MYINWPFCLMYFQLMFLKLSLLSDLFYSGCSINIGVEFIIHWWLVWNIFFDHFYWNYRTIHWDYLHCCYRFHNATKSSPYRPSEVYFYPKSHLRNQMAILSVLKLNYPHFEVILGLSFLPKCVNCRYKSQVHGCTDKD